MHATRLLEAALGRQGLQLHDGLRRRTDLPSPSETMPTPSVRAGHEGWWVRWAERPWPRGVVLAARLLDSKGVPRRADGPFVDDRGQYLWCRILDDRPLWIPWAGVPAGASTLQLVAFEPGRGPARAVASVTVPLPPAPGLPWDALAWARPIVVLARALVHADGVIRSSQRYAMSGLLRELGLDDIDLDAVLSLPTPASLEPAVLRTHARLAGWGSRTLLEHLARVAVANGAPSPQERAVLLEIATAMDVPPRAIERLLAGWGPAVRSDVPDLAAAYALLGLRDGVSRDTIKRAWRDRMRACHPDRVPASDGVARAEATRRSAELNVAMELLLEHAETARPAPPRMGAPVDEDAVPEPESLPDLPRRRGLTHVQMAMGFVALALLAFAIGLALNGHVELAFEAVGEAVAQRR